MFQFAKVVIRNMKLSPPATFVTVIAVGCNYFYFPKHSEDDLVKFLSKAI
jgi:hypothetical protein